MHPAPPGPLPPYLRRENFEAIRGRAERVDGRANAPSPKRCRRAQPESFDAYVLLDAQDWMTDAQLNALWAEITRTAQPGRARRLPHRRGADAPPRPRRRRHPAALDLRRGAEPRAHRRGPLVDLWRLPPLRLQRMSRAAGSPTADALMDRIYGRQRHIYDLTRKYFLLGRDALIAELEPPAGGSVIEIGCGTGRNLIAAARAYPDAAFFGLDVSSAMLSTARANIRQSRARDADQAGARRRRAFRCRRAFRARYVRPRVLLLQPLDDPALARGARPGVCAWSSRRAGGSWSSTSASSSGFPPGSGACCFAWLAKFHVSPRAELGRGARRARRGERRAPRLPPALPRLRALRGIGALTPRKRRKPAILGD